MKTIRIILFCLFVISASITINMFYNLLRNGIGYGTWQILAVAILLVAVQLNGLIFVIINRSRVLAGLFAIVTGIATVFSGIISFSSLGAPAPQVLGVISLISLVASIIIFIGYICLGILYFTTSPDSQK